MKKLLLVALVSLFAFSVMAVEHKAAPAAAGEAKIEKEIKSDVPAVPPCEGKKILKKCKKAKDVSKVEAKFKCACPEKK